jgi:O-antigen ligase
MSIAAGERNMTSPGAMVALFGLAVILAIAIVASAKLALFGLIGALFFVFFLMYPVLGLYATTVLLLLQGASGVLSLVNDTAPMAITLASLGGAAAISAWMANLLVRKAGIMLNWPMLVMAGFIAWALFSTILGVNIESGLPHWARLAVRFAYFVFAINVLNTRTNIQYFVVTILFCSFLMAGSGVVQYFMPSLQVTAAQAIGGVGTGGGAFVDTESLQGEAAIRVSGRAGHSNWLAMILLIVLPLNYFWMSLAKTKRTKLLIWVAVITEVAALVLTFTRTGLVIGVVIAFLFLMRGLVRVTPMRVFAVLGLMAMGWLALPGPYKERVLNFSMYTSSKSVSSRLELQKAAARYTVENPVRGLGIGGFGEEFVHEGNETSTTMRYMVFHNGWQAIFIGTHNMYLQISADTGLVGLALYLCFFAMLLNRMFALRRHYKAEGDALGGTLTDTTLIAQIAFLVCAIFLHALHQEIWWMLVALGVALTQYKIDFKGPLPKWGISTEAHRA